MKDLKINFDNTYAQLPERFYEHINPIPVKNPAFLLFNKPLAKELNLDADKLYSNKSLPIFAGNKIPQGAMPIALAYAGHQFGHFVPKLGDGRAILLGEIIDKKNKHRDIQLKGSGQTPFSRQGDGRAPLGAIIREYIVSEAMHKLGIKTTRSLAAISTGEPVFRETISPGGILTRVAESHVRVGTFEYFAYRQDKNALQLLADYVINRHYPYAKEDENPYQTLFKELTKTQAILIVKWMTVGFIHGVMNTDNMSISGETIDYGPCAFMEEYNPNTVFSAIDHYGRYAYQNQAYIAQWNLAKLGEILLPFLQPNKYPNQKKAIEFVQETLDSFKEIFENHWLSSMKQKIGLSSNNNNEDSSLIQSFLNLMYRYKTDYTLSFRLLSEIPDHKEKLENLYKLFSHNNEIKIWIETWKQRLKKESNTPAEISSKMKTINPAFIPRNHLVEQAINSAIHNADLSKTHKLISILSKPYTEQKEYTNYMKAAKANERVEQTFCGT